MIEKLNYSHKDKVRHLFSKSDYMGVGKNKFTSSYVTDINEDAYNIFCDNYLTDLSSFHAYGSVNPNTGLVDAFISYYESEDDPSWYYTIYRSSGNYILLKDILDRVIEVNEAKGRLKFFTLVNSEHSKLLRKFTWSKYNDARYGWVDECVIPANTKPFYIHHWELLFKRILIPVNTTVRCNFLKQEYRTSLPTLGDI